MRNNSSAISVKSQYRPSTHRRPTSADVKRPSTRESNNGLANVHTTGFEITLMRAKNYESETMCETQNAPCVASKETIPHTRKRLKRPKKHSGGNKPKRPTDVTFPKGGTDEYAKSHPPNGRRRRPRNTSIREEMKIALSTKRRSPHATAYI